MKPVPFRQYNYKPHPVIIDIFNPVPYDINILYRNYRVKSILNQEILKMKISFAEKENEVIFRINDVDEKYYQVLKDCFYQQEGKDYFKKFPKDSRDLSIIQHNFSLYADKMFGQAGHFLPVPWEQALSEFIERVNESEINWWLVSRELCCMHPGYHDKTT